jgi:hypothetical protein
MGINLSQKAMAAAAPPPPPAETKKVTAYHTDEECKALIDKFKHQPGYGYVDDPGWAQLTDDDLDSMIKMLAKCHKDLLDLRISPEERKFLHGLSRDQTKMASNWLVVAHREKKLKITEAGDLFIDVDYYWRKLQEVKEWRQQSKSTAHALPRPRQRKRKR